MDPAAAPTGLVPDQNVWRIAHADRASVIVDADEYFRIARAAMLKAKRRIMLIGWDFDARIRLGDAVPDDGGPDTVGAFITWLAKRNPALDVHLLRWDLGAVKALFRGTTIFTILNWMRHPRIHPRLDSAHPTGGSHHQKIVVIDDCFAFCGGIDMTAGRWDTRAHADDDGGRTDPGGTAYGPWHDATTALSGPAAVALGDHARHRWQLAGGGKLDPVKDGEDCWPDILEPQFTDVAIGIARSAPKMGDVDPIVEIERLYLSQIAAARRHIYAESQYFASRRVAEAIARRLDEPDGPEIVIINPVTAQGWLEPLAMDTARARLVEALRRRDRHGRFRLYHPHTAGGEPIYVHAKIMIVDDRMLRVGSSNLNNRSLRLDTECDIVIDTEQPGNGDEAATIAAIRNDLIAEHLGLKLETVAARLAETGSLIATIEGLRGDGRTLRDYETPDLADIEKWLADNEVLDPEGPDEMFEALSGRSLFKRLRKPK
jgi:phosphatidylserine/phosphatidylglycerophosphate/cardiolipin synthase-like enzyme